MKDSPILILHGWNLSNQYYRKLISNLKNKGFLVYGPDLPGFGSNNVLDKSLNLTDYVDFVIRFLKTNKIQKPIIIGHSFGGRIALKLAAKYPQLVSALILTGVPGYLPVSSLKRKLFLIIAKFGGELFKLPILNIFANLTKKSMYKLAGSFDYYNSSGYLRKTFQNIIKEDLENYLFNIKLPVFLIWGKEDKIVPISIAEKMNAAIKGSKIKAIEGAGHKLPYSHTGIFTTSMIEFLDKL